MYECCTDENGEKYGWGRVLDYINIGWEDDPYQANKKKDKELILPGQINMFDFM